MFKIKRKIKILPSESMEVTENAEVQEEIGDELNSQVKTRKQLKTWQKTLIIIGGSILTLVLVAVITVAVLEAQGKKSIYNNAIVAGALNNGNNNSDNNDIVSNEDRVIAGGDGSSSTDSTDETDSQEGTGSSSGDSTSGGSTDKSNMEVSVGDSVDNADNNPYTEPEHSVSKGDSDTSVKVDGEEYVYNEDIITMLFLGVDKLTEVEGVSNYIQGGQSDAIYLLVLNPDTEVMNVIAIPRDTIALLDVYKTDGSYSYSGYGQICLQHAYGDALTLSNQRAALAVSRLMSNPYILNSPYDYNGEDEFPTLPIHSCTSMNMGAVPALNDVIGGVTLSSLYTFDTGNNSFVEGTTYTLMGTAAYDYVHFRDITRHYTATERLNRQKQYINLFVNSAVSKVKNNPISIVDIYNTVSNFTVTDLNTSRMVYLATQAAGYSFGQIYTLEGTIDTSGRYERFYADPDALTELIMDIFYEKK